MHPLMKHRKIWGPHSLKWPQPISLSFSNMFANFVFHMQSKTAWWVWSFWHNIFYSSVWVKRQRAARPPSNDKRMAVETSSSGGKNEMLQSVEARSRESWTQDKNVSIHANWCPDPPPGCHCLLSGKGIKGLFTRHEHFQASSVRSYPAITSFKVSCAPLPSRWWKRNLSLRLIEKEAGSVSLRCTWKYQRAHKELVFQSRGEGRLEFSVRVISNGSTWADLATQSRDRTEGWVLGYSGWINNGMLVLSSRTGDAWH